MLLRFGSKVTVLHLPNYTSGPGRHVGRSGPVKAASEALLAVLDAECLPPCRAEPTLHKVTFAIWLVFRRVFSKAAFNESGIFECLPVPHKRTG